MKLKILSLLTLRRVLSPNHPISRHRLRFTNLGCWRKWGPHSVPPIVSIFVILLGSIVHAMTLDDALDIVQNKYRSLNTLSANFTQTTRLKLLNKNVTSTGTLQLKKPGKMRIDYDDANSKSYISDGKSLWVVDKATRQTDKFKIGSGEVPKEALTFLNGFGDIRETYGVATWSADKIKTNGLQLQLVPQKETSYTALDTIFDATGVLQKLSIHNRSGNVSHYSFINIVENPPLADTLFRAPH